MEQERVIHFTHLIDGIHKRVQKLRTDYAANFGVKGVHVFWVYELLSHPEGLSAASLAASSKIDRSLISREIKALESIGYIRAEKQSGKRGYNSKIVLTESGIEAAHKMRDIMMDFQNLADDGVSKSDLEIFYSVLEKINYNLEKTDLVGSN
ncbi:MAG: transcriptional regulator [Clostridia bacterium]|nr:transcriptional regulator [Clostridia bacterium]